MGAFLTGGVRRAAFARLFFFLLFFFCLSFASAEAAEFDGAYKGIAGAAGYRLTLTQDGQRVTGQLRPPSGGAFALNGHRTGNAAQGSARRGQTQHYFHFEERPLGVQFLLIPSGADGQPRIGEALEMSFMKEGLRVPESAQREEKKAPEAASLLTFIDGFRSWSPKEMARLYRGLDARDRDLLLLFDHISAELLWRVCAGNPPHGSFTAEDLLALLKRQDVTCADYLDLVSRVRDAGLIEEFVRKVNFQLDILRETVKCAEGGEKEHCADVGALRAPIVARWRPADAIMMALSEGYRRPEAAPLPPLAPPEEMQETPEEKERPGLVPGAPLPLARPDVAAADAAPTLAPGVPLPLAPPR